MWKVESIHSSLPVGSRSKCQFCNNTATVVICNLIQEPTIWMCDEHALHFAEGIVEDVGGTTSAKAARSVKKQEHLKKKEKQMEKQALHAS